MLSVAERRTSFFISEKAFKFVPGWWFVVCQALSSLFSIGCLVRNEAQFDLHFEFNCKLDVSAETPGNVYLVKSTVQMTFTIEN